MAPPFDATSLTGSNFKHDLFAAGVLSHMADRLQTLGFINRQIEQARAEWKLGDTVKLKKTQRFTAQSTPFANMASIEQLKPEDVNLKVDQYLTVGMRMNEIEQVQTGTEAWNNTVRRLGYAMASKVEQKVHELFYAIPHSVIVALSAFDKAVLTKCNRIFQENGVPEDGAQLRRVVVNPLMWEKFLADTAFSQHQGAGNSGVLTQQSGDLPEKFGLVPYYSNNLATEAAGSNVPTGGNETAAAPAGASIVGGGLKGDKTVVLTYTGLAAPTVFTKGQVIQLATTAEGLLAPTAGKAYRYQLYAVESATAVVANNTTVTLTQALRQDHAGTWRRIQQAGAGDVAVMQAGGFYADAFALAMVELPREGPGVNFGVATDGTQGLSLRSREIYDPWRMERALILDGYFGVKTLDPDKGVRISVNLNA